VCAGPPGVRGVVAVNTADVMANKKRSQRSDSASANRPGAARRAARPAPDSQDAKTPADRTRPGESTTANYLVPAGLAAALVVSLVWYFRAQSHVPAEPTATPGAQPPPAASASPSPVNLAEGAQHGRPSGGGNTEPVRRVPPTPPPTEVPPSGGQAQNVAVTPVHPEPTSPDPRAGHFTLAQATEGLPSGTRLVADIETSMGTFNCDLWPDRAPTTVANFVGLARGRRDFWDPVAGRWVRRPFYDGSVFHRVIPGFMIQGGDILRNGSGGPGYVIPDENVDNHNEGGLMAMANRGRNTGGAQFFIQEVARAHLNGSYSVFGRCAPLNLVERIARTPRTDNDQPLTPVYIRAVRVHR
jgi:peptidyl-prolyl cis-trans isomerase A (cyclophilin A)